MMEIYQNKILLNNKEMVFETDILEAVYLDEKLIVVFATNEDNPYDNVYCFNQCKKMIWRIQQVPKEIGGTARTPYVGVDIIGGYCRVIDFFGRRFVIDSDNGHIISKDIVR